MFKVDLNENVYLGNTIEFNAIISKKDNVLESNNPYVLANNIYNNIVMPMIRDGNDNKPLDWRVTENGNFVGVISWNGRFWTKEEQNGVDYWNMSLDEIKESTIN